MNNTRRKVMQLRHSKKLAVAAICLAALIAGRAALAHAPAEPISSGTTAPLYSRALALGDLQGFWPTACPVAVTASTEWARHSLSVSMLARNGFVNGVREPLQSRDSTMRATNSVAQYRTAQGARLAADEELAHVSGPTEPFVVPSIPGAYGYRQAGGRSERLSISFSQGRFEYRLTVSGVRAARAAEMRSRLVEAALHLYRKSGDR
jgi:hypothetical protein